MKFSIFIAAAFFGLGFAHPASEAADFHKETRAELSELIARQFCCDFRVSTLNTTVGIYIFEQMLIAWHTVLHRRCK